MRISQETLNVLAESDKGAEAAVKQWKSLAKFQCHADSSGFGIWVAGYWHPFQNEFVVALEAESNN